MKYIANTAENIFRTDKPLIFSWVYQHNCTDINLSKTALPLEKHHHTCLPCQREVDWRQDTSLDFIAFCLRYVHPFYAANFSAVKTEGLPHLRPLPHTNPSKTALSLENCQHPCHMNALLVSQNVANRQHPCLPSKKGRWHGWYKFFACCTVFR